jgi:hypothetical protein
VTALRQVVALVFLAFAAFVVWVSHGLSLWAEYGPGPGFFSFWLGLILAVLALVEGASARRAPRQRLPATFLPDREGVRRLLAIVGALIAALVLLQGLGFTPTMFLFAVFLLRAMGSQRWLVTLLIALLGSAGTFYLFQQLQVFLPAGPLGF